MFTAVQTDKMRKKSSHFRTSSSLNMAVRGGLTRFARPAGSPLTAFTVCPTGCRQLSNPGRGFSSPWLDTYEKGPYLRTGLSLNMAVRGGLTRCARPSGVMACGHSVPLAAPVVEPRRGFSSPWLETNEKGPYLRTGLSQNMAVRGGFEPPIRCRIHTFQACSFSHSDTSPYFFIAAQRGATGRYYRESG